MENWCYHKDTLLSIAKHFETGELLPEEIYAKLVAAKNFRAGTFSLRQIRFASVDMELHTMYDPSGSFSIYDVDRRVAERTQVLAPLPEDKFLGSFSHIFAGGYAAGYYSYKSRGVSSPCSSALSFFPACFPTYFPLVVLSSGERFHALPVPFATLGFCCLSSSGAVVSSEQHRVSLANVGSPFDWRWNPQSSMLTKLGVRG